MPVFSDSTQEFILRKAAETFYHAVEANEIELATVALYTVSHLPITPQTLGLFYSIDMVPDRFRTVVNDAIQLHFNFGVSALDPMANLFIDLAFGKRVVDGVPDKN